MASKPGTPSLTNQNYSSKIKNMAISPTETTVNKKVKLNTKSRTTSGNGRYSRPHTGNIPSRLGTITPGYSSTKLSRNVPKSQFFEIFNSNKMEKSDIGMARPLSATAIHKKNDLVEKLTAIRPFTCNKMNPLTDTKKAETYIGPIPKFQQSVRKASLSVLDDAIDNHSEIVRKLNIEYHVDTKHKQQNQNDKQKLRSKLIDSKENLKPSLSSHFVKSQTTIPDIPVAKVTTEIDKSTIHSNLNDDSKPTFPFSKKHVKIEEMINLSQLQVIKQYFDQFNGKIDNVNFTKILLHVLNLSPLKYEKHVRNLFMKIDTNSKSRIDWDQFCSYMQIELQEKERIHLERNRVRFNLPAIKATNLQYRDVYDTIAIEELNDGGFITANKDGTVLIFPRPKGAGHPLPDVRKKIAVKKFSNLTNEKNQKEDAESTINKKWITDISIAKKYNKVFVSTGDRELMIYELSSGELYATMEGLRRLPVKIKVECLDEKLIIVIGDQLGCISLIKIDNASEVLRNWSKQVEVKKNDSKEGVSSGKAKEIKGVISLDDIVKKFYPNVTHTRVQLHDDWITQIQIIPETREVYTSSNSPITSLVKSSFSGKNSDNRPNTMEDVRPKDRSTSIRAETLSRNDVRKNKNCMVFSVRKGIKAFAYCKEKLVIITGGLDRLLRLWNPYVPQKPTGTVIGHQAPIEMVKIDATNSIFISIDLNKNVKVWNLGDQTLLTDVYPKSHMMSKAEICQANYLFAATTLIVCTDNIYSISMKPRTDLRPMNETANKRKPHISIILTTGTNEAYTHKDPITAIVYNKCFDQIITCSATSVCRVWNAATGELIFEFGGVETQNDGTEKQTNETCHRDGHNGNEITSAILDDTGRRLITTSRDGKTCIWNPNSGACLKTLMTKAKRNPEVQDSVIVTINQRNKFICTVGWDKRIRLYADLKSEGDYKAIQYPSWEYDDDIKRGHKEDIIACAYCPPNLLATADYGGNLFFWNLVSGHISLKIKYNLKQTPLQEDLPGSRQVIHTVLGFPERHSKNEQLISEQFSRPATRQTIISNSDSSKQGSNIQSNSNLREGSAVIAIGTCDGFVSFYAYNDGDAYASICLTNKTSCGYYPAVTSLKLSQDEKLLVVGDSTGYITIVNISNFTLKKENKNAMPIILRRWRAHIFAINGISILLTNNRSTSNTNKPDTFKDSYQLVSISDDKRARVWTFSGMFVGTFGQEKPWDCILSSTWQHPSTPEDVLFHHNSLPKTGETEKYKDLSDLFFDEETKENKDENFRKTVMSNATSVVKSKRHATLEEVDQFIVDMKSALPELKFGKQLRAVTMSKDRERMLNNPKINDAAYDAMFENAIFRKILVFDLQDSPIPRDSKFRGQSVGNGVGKLEDSENREFKSIQSRKSTHIPRINETDDINNQFQNLDSINGRKSKLGYSSTVGSAKSRQVKFVV